MPDNITPAPAPAGSSSPSVDPGQIASMRETWVAQGLDPAKFDAAVAGDSGSPAAALTPPEVVSPLSGQPRLADDKAGELARALLDAGVDPAKVNEALAQDGYEFEMGEDPRSDEEREFERAFGPEHPAPDAYKINWRDRIDGDVGVVAEANTQATAWLSELGIEPSVGAHLIETAYDVGSSYSGMSEGEQTLYKAEQNALFTRLAGGPEEAQRLLTCAALAVKAGDATFTQRLHDSGAMHSAEIILHLARHGERLLAREDVGQRKGA